MNFVPTDSTDGTNVTFSMVSKEQPFPDPTKNILVTICTTRLSMLVPITFWTFCSNWLIPEEPTTSYQKDIQMMI